MIWSGRVTFEPMTCTSTPTHESMRPPRGRVACVPQRPNDSAGRGEDGNKARRQQDHLEILLAEQLVVDEFARGSNPEQTLASHVMRSTTSMAVLLRAALNAAPQLERLLLRKIQRLLPHVLHGA